MALKVKDVGTSAEKWTSNAQSASGEYAANAEAAANQWASETAKSDGTWQQAVSAAGVKERYRRGVQQAGAAKYARKIRDVGAGRYGSGVSAAQADYVAGFTPYAQTLTGLNLDQRKPRGDPANYNRVQQVGKALHAKRLAMLGAGSGG